MRLSALVHVAVVTLTIIIGVFADDDCSEYIGNAVNIENVLGYELEGDELAPYVAGSLADVIHEEGIQAQKEQHSQNCDAELAEYYSHIDNVCIHCMASRQLYKVQGTVEDYDYQDQS